jgi:hypothetical protein
MVRSPPQADTPSVSVVIPTYQRRKLVGRAVWSVLEQSHQDFELIVVDDGSDDGTEQSLADIDPRLHYYRQEHRGVPAARNTALRHARGSVVAFLDSDDRWLPDHLAVITDALRMNPSAVLATTCPRMRVAGRQQVEDAEMIDALPSLLATLGLFAWPSCVGIRRSALSAVGGFDERFVVGDDGEIWVRLAALGPFCLVRRKTIVHRETRGSLKYRGARVGEALRAFELFGESAAAVVARLARPARDARAARAEGAIRYASALRALERHDDEAARAALADACRLLPDLSRDPEQVARRLVRIGHQRTERLHCLTVAATGWPDPASDTALFLRARAIGTALVVGRPRVAARLLQGWPLRSTPGFVARILPVAKRVAGRRVRDYLHGGRESRDLVDG